MQLIKIEKRLAIILQILLLLANILFWVETANGCVNIYIYIQTWQYKIYYTYIFITFLYNIPFRNSLLITIDVETRESAFTNVQAQSRLKREKVV